jgi:thioredoxin reductase (NADPH)
LGREVDVDVIVVGGGVAALTAAAFAARLGLQTVVVADVLIGGQILNVEEIGNFPGFPEAISGADFGALVEQQATGAGAEFVFDQAQSITVDGAVFTVSGPAGDLSAPAVIVATGSTLRRLGVPGEDRLEGRGVSYCGSCDAAMFAGRRVAVIGGGDSAADEALVVAEHAAEVVVVLREPELHAAASTRARVRAHERIRIQTQREPLEILGDAVVSGLRLHDVRADEEYELAVEGVFVFVGLAPNTGLLAPLVALDDNGHVPTTPWMETTVPGLFAAGDIRRDSPGQLVNVASDGATAAIAAHRYVEERRP